MTPAEILAGVCQRFGFWSDGKEILAECETCHRRRSFRSEYFARDWANKHATGRA